MQSRSSLELEREKFQASQKLQSQTQQHELILKMVSVGDEKQARANLKFIAEAHLVSADLAERILALKDIAVLPQSSATARPTSRDFQAIRSDDDAIDLVIAWEGGFAAGPVATNGGITLATLSAHLGREATLDELRDLPKPTMRDVYRRFIAPVAAFDSVLVRAAYLNQAVLRGPARTMRTLQTAAGRVLGREITADGMLGPQSIERINSIPDKNLLVETANCILISELKQQPNLFATFGNGWIRRARAFSPDVLRGVCAELQPAAAADAHVSSAASP
jgi:lysozyme family protein